MPSKFGFETGEERRAREEIELALAAQGAAHLAAFVVRANRRAEQLDAIVREVLIDFAAARETPDLTAGFEPSRPHGYLVGASDPTWTLAGAKVDLVLVDADTDAPGLDLMTEDAAEDEWTLALVLHQQTGLPVSLRRLARDWDASFGFVGGIHKDYEEVVRFPPRPVVAGPVSTGATAKRRSLVRNVVKRVAKPVLAVTPFAVRWAAIVLALCLVDWFVARPALPGRAERVDFIWLWLVLGAILAMPRGEGTRVALPAAGGGGNGGSHRKR